ncbi:hypothetical protein FHS96_001938 [Sphingomonas zeicaulis]|uniref:dipeptidyl-peptidase 3 family protein n=1 Tax=Sphingomonas zeicaulis TaxID=1632740 RepID=UPI003D1DDFF2
MRKTLIAALLLATTAACSGGGDTNQTDTMTITPTDRYDIAAQRAKIARIDMNVDTAFLSDEEKKVVNLLIKASDLMSQIYLRQAYAANPEVRTQIAAMPAGPKRDALLDMFDLHFGPWDTLAEDHAFFGRAQRPAGAGFYPADLTRAQFDAYLAKHPDEKAALTDAYTVVKREGDRLVAVPYSVAYREWLEPAAKLLEEAAATTTNPSLKRFLSLRAKAFGTNDYYESELAWMDLSGTPIEIAIGPYEVYTDKLYGAKTAFESFLTIKNPEESAALDKYKRYLRDMEANLPVEERFKNFQRGFASPIVVAEQIRGGGDNVPGVQTVAFNLPNDERVREAKGAKKVILANVLGAKFDRILQPMAGKVLVPDQAGLVVKKYMEAETLFHELSHSLGPGSITVDGRKTTVNAELKELNSALEEGKADIMGVWNILFMMEKGEMPAAEEPQLWATYFAGIFRAVRFGIDEAHGQGAAMQYSYLKEKGAFVWDEEARRYRIDNAKMRAGLAALIADVVRLQGTGDYAGTKAFLSRYGKLDDDAETVIEGLNGIPVDIQPKYPSGI